MTEHLEVAFVRHQELDVRRRLVKQSLHNLEALLIVEHKNGGIESSPWVMGLDLEMEKELAA